MSDVVSKLDQQLLLAHVLHKPRSYVLAHQPLTLTTTQQQQYERLLERRYAGEPLAYLLQVKEFWSLPFFVNTDVLIPRPDTECLVEYVLNRYAAQHKLSIADIGTGSGAIAVSLAHEKPQWQVSATDISVEALAVAKRNALTHHTQHIQFLHGDLCAVLEQPQDCIISNPPYIAENDAHLAALTFEPECALVADDDGLAVIKRLIGQAKLRLKQDGLLVIEHGYDQAKAVRQLMQDGYVKVETRQDLAGRDRFTFGVRR